jgi:hypothetical protein
VPEQPRQALERLLMELQQELSLLRDENSLLRECLEIKLEADLLRDLLSLLQQQKLPPEKLGLVASLSRH